MLPASVRGHISSWNKSAMVVFKHKELFTILKDKMKPVYFRKDILTEKIWGYRFVGYFPTNVLLNARYLFQTGIVEWWQKYFDFVVVLKTRTKLQNLTALNFKINTTLTAGGDKVSPAVLSIIHGVGLLISLFIFIVEIRCWYDYILKLVLCTGTLWTQLSFHILRGCRMSDALIIFVYKSYFLEK